LHLSLTPCTGIVSFDEIEKGVGRLLDEFGPPRKTQPIYPFWYLQNDGLWQLTNIEQSKNGTLGPCPTKTFIKSRDVRGRFPAEIEKQLSSNPELLKQIASTILESNFPATLHHKLFDRGAFSLDPDRRLIVSENAHGNDSFDQWLMRFHGTVIQPPQRNSYTPLDDFTEWHINEVFKGNPREFIIR